MAKVIFSTLLLSSLLLLTSCEEVCSCAKEWQQEAAYAKGDIVLWQGKCWYAVRNGQGIVPHAWLKNGNTMWQQCLNDE